MITKDKLAVNLKKLKSSLPSKPEVYTQEHPRKIKEALVYYCNRRTLHGLQFCTINLNEENWPLPLWFQPENVKVGFWNRLYYFGTIHSWTGKWKIFKELKDFSFCSVIVLNHVLDKLSLDDIIVEAFDANKKDVFKVLSSNPLFESKRKILESIRKSYQNKNWLACISTIFPLIDFTSRRLLGTNSLRHDVSKICKLFELNGFSIQNANDLMPFGAFSYSMKEGEPLFTREREKWLRKMEETDFGIIGPALSSFIKFANIYYGYYIEENETEEVQSLINRHAILHGAISNFGNKVNAVKLITFLYLMLELEDVFNILLEE